jgi:dUTP pyrophosphatase
MDGPITIQIRRRGDCEDVPLPAYMTEHAAGMDLCAACAEPIALAPGETATVPCGFEMALPVGYEAQIRPRSGLAARYGITIPNAPGTIDADYRGEVKVILVNHGRAPLEITRGMRIAQMVVAPVTRAQLSIVTSLEQTARGSGGFGHTGH